MKTAQVSWTPNDVQDLFQMTDTEAEDWLNDNAKYIQEAMVQRGWEAIESLGHESNLTRISEED